MTVSTTSAVTTYDKPALGWLLAVYDFTFKIFSDDDLHVSFIDATTGVETVLDLETDYTVDGVGDEDGGTITITVAGQAKMLGDYLVIRRVMDLLQPTNFTNQGFFFAKNHEQAFDRIVMMLQQVGYIADRALRLADGPDASTFDFTLPPIAPGEAIIFAADGEGLDSISTADLKGDQGDPGDPGPQGDPGADGRTVWHGAGDPSNALGVDDDFYINTTNWTLFGPKAGVWPEGISLIGPAGADSFTQEQGDLRYEKIEQPFYDAGPTGAFLVLTWTVARQRQKITIDANTTLRIEGIPDGGTLELLVTVSGAGRTLGWEADTGLSYVHMSNGGVAPTPPGDGKMMSLLIIRDGAVEYVYQTGANE